MSNAKQKKPEKLSVGQMQNKCYPSHYNLYIVSHSIVMTKMNSL